MVFPQFRERYFDLIESDEDRLVGTSYTVGQFFEMDFVANVVLNGSVYIGFCPFLGHVELENKTSLSQQLPASLQSY